MGFRNAFDAEHGERIAKQVRDKVLALAAKGGDAPEEWGQRDWDKATRAAIFELSNDLCGDDIKALIAYATDECDGWEIMEIGLDAALGAAIWCLWENEG